MLFVSLLTIVFEQMGIGVCVLKRSKPVDTNA
jgi:hypothetical protein